MSKEIVCQASARVLDSLSAAREFRVSSCHDPRSFDEWCSVAEVCAVRNREDRLGFRSEEIFQLDRLALRRVTPDSSE
jgi:hypothetical protein